MNESHLGHLTIVETIHTGQHGQPPIHIDPEFLQWAYSLRPISSIAYFLGVSWGLVCQQLVEYGIAEPQSQPFMLSVAYTNDGGDNFLDPSGEVSSPTSPPDNTSFTTSYTSPQLVISDDELDELLVRLNQHYCCAGVTMLDGMLYCLGYRIPREHIIQSLVQVDPV
jgi:hypothetical protein